MNGVVLPDEAVGVVSTKYGITDYIYDFFCCLSATLEIPADQLYACGKVCCYGGESLQVDNLDLVSIKEYWVSFKNSGLRAVGAGKYAEYALLTLGREYEVLQHARDKLLLVKLKPGETIERLRNEINLMTRSERQSGTVALYREDLFAYWSVFREVVQRGHLMKISHITESEYLESEARLSAGLLPYRRYNTPAMRRSPKQDTQPNVVDRASFKWMALEIINGVRALTGSPPLDEADVLLDERGVLRVPIANLYEEHGFVSLWLKIERVWSRIVRVEPYRLPDLSGLDDSELIIIQQPERVVTIDGVKYEIIVQ